MLVQHQLGTNYCLLGTKFEQFAAAAGKVLIIAVPFRRPQTLLPRICTASQQAWGAPVDGRAPRKPSTYQVSLNACQVLPRQNQTGYKSRFSQGTRKERTDEDKIHDMRCDFLWPSEGLRSRLLYTTRKSGNATNWTSSVWG